jgi:hypothetical protein
MAARRRCARRLLAFARRRKEEGESKPAAVAAPMPEAEEEGEICPITFVTATASESMRKRRS